MWDLSGWSLYNNVPTVTENKNDLKNWKVTSSTQMEKLWTTSCFYNVYWNPTIPVYFVE